MLPALLNVPHTNEEWSQFAFAHRDSHNQIRQAIQKKYGVLLTDFQIDPINPNSMQQWLQNNSQLHDDMNSTLRLPSVNLDIVDLSQDNQKVAWINYHYLEHYYAHAALGI